MKTMGMLSVIMRAILLSTGVISMAVILKSSQPATLEILSNNLSIVSWINIKPPYLYIIINCIIISIVASSKLHPRGTTTASIPEEREYPFVAAAVEAAEEVEEEVKEVVFGYAAREQKNEVDDEIVVVESVVKAEAVAETEKEKEKVSYSARFGHRKPVKASPEGKTVLKKVSRPKRQETLESTWRTITEGRSMPLTRHLRKSDTFTGASQEASSPVQLMKKSDTFSYGGVAESPPPGSSGGGKLRREPSLSQDDLNRRVEAFIKKFNEEMRLQRQESFKQYRQRGKYDVH